MHDVVDGSMSVFSRSAATAIGLFVIFIATRAPSEVYNLMKLFHQVKSVSFDNVWWALISLCLTEQLRT